MRLSYRNMSSAAVQTMGARRTRRTLKRRLKIWTCVTLIVFNVVLAAVTIFSVNKLNWAAGLIPKLPELMAVVERNPSTIVSDDGETLFTIAAEFRKPVMLDEVPRNVISATLAAEDVRFYQHRGVDMIAVARVVVSAAKNKGKPTSGGGSTLSMQLSKRLYTSEAQTLSRKLDDMAIATMMERKLTKNQILELYLNQVYYGEGAYGIAAAADVYFGKSLEDLTLSEAALLARCVRRPSDENPVADLERAIHNRNVVLKVMLDENLIDQAEYDAAVAEDVILRHKPAPITSDKKVSPFFVDYVLKEIKTKYPDIDLSQGGYRVETTLDSRYQEIAEEAVAKGIRDNSRKKVNYGAAVLVSKNGFIRAMVGGPDYSKDQYNIAAQGGRQPGSSFKPIVYATAFERGALSAGGYVSNDTFMIQDGSRKRAVASGGPKSNVSVVQALTWSYNSAACWAQSRTGTMNVIHYAKERFGLDGEIPVAETLALGVADVNPLEMAEVYSVFQNGGTRTEPIAIRRIIGPDGLTVVRETPKQHKRMLAPKTAENMDAILRSVVVNGTGRSARSATNARGKTGTTSDNKDVWFCGYTDELIGIVWLGNVRQRVDKDGNRLSPVYEQMSSAAMGGQVAAPVWANMVSKAQKLAGEKSRRISSAIVRSSTRDEVEEETEPEEEVPETSPADTTPPPPTNDNGTGVTITPPPVTTNPPRTTGGTGGGGNAEPPADRLSVWICAESGQRATAYCPERVQRTFRRGSEPRGTCPLHRPPTARLEPREEKGFLAFLHAYLEHEDH